MLDTSSKASKYQVEDFAGKIESFCCCCCFFCCFFFHEGAGVGQRALTSWTEIYFMLWFSSFQNCLPKHHEIVISSYHKPQLNPQHSKVNSPKFSQYTANARWFCKKVLSISGDGKLLIWQLSPGSHDLKLVSGFILQTESVPRSMRLSKARGDAEMGGTVLFWW